MVWVGGLGPVGLVKHLAFRGLADRIDKAITASSGQGASTKGVGFGVFFLGVNQRMVNGWFGARWFGIK